MSDPVGPGGRRTPFIPHQRTRGSAPDDTGTPLSARPSLPTQRRTSSPSILPHQRRPPAATDPPPGQVGTGRATGTGSAERSDTRATYWLAVLRFATGSLLVGAICADALGWRYPAGVGTNHDGSFVPGVLDPTALAGLAGLGVVAVLAMFGVLLRVAAAIGIVLFFVTWASHVGSLDIGVRALVAVVLLALAAGSAGDTWGFGRRWAALPLVRRHRWLR
jgi:hypothetical protein